MKLMTQAAVEAENKKDKEKEVLREVTPETKKTKLKG